MKFKDYITETSLSRVWGHMKEHDSGTITSFRDRKDCGNGDVYTRGQKKARNKVLLAQLLKERFSVTSVKGKYIENYGSPDAKEVGESVFFVVDINDSGKLKKTLMKFGEEYEQDSILFIPKGGKEGFLIGTNHCENGYPGYGKINKLKNPVFGNSGEFFTRVNGRPFTLKESFKDHSKPSSGMGNWAMSAIANGGWEKHYNENIEIFEDEIDFHKLSQFMNEAPLAQKVLYDKYIRENKPEALKELIDSVVEVING